jgi:hypothetical protein
MAEKLYGDEDVQYKLDYAIAVFFALAYGVIFFL